MRVDSRLLMIAALGFLAVVVFALSDVEQQPVTYDLQPAEQVDGDRAVAPLALATAEPDRLAVSLPCDEGSGFSTMNHWVWWASPGAEHSPLVYRGLGDDLAVMVGADEVDIDLGERRLMSLPTSDDADCRVAVDYHDGTLDVVAGEERSAASIDGFRVAEAEVTGPAATDPRTRITITTTPIGSSPSPLQVVAALVAIVLLAATARGLAQRSRGADGSADVRIDTPRNRFDWSDGLVGLVLLLWLFIIPTNIDDGWTGAIQRSYDAYGDFSGIFVNGAAAPIGYWLNWLQHHWLALSDSLVWARIPGVVGGAVAWWGIRRLIGPVRRSERLMSVGIFVVGFAAWGLTLRPEPIVMALVVLSLVSATWFRQGRRGWYLVGWLVIVVLGLTSHPTGLLVLAPVIASVRPLWAWARSAAGRVAAVASTLFVGGLGLLLLTVDTNLPGLLDRLGAVRSSGLHSQTALDELSRYDLLGQTPYATIMMRVSVALIVIGAVAFAVRRSAPDTPHHAAGWSLVAGLGLLTLVPSKWPVHFAGLLGPSVVLLRFEVVRWWSAERRWRDGALSIGAIGLLLYAWSISKDWNAFDLRTVEWWSGLDLSSPVTVLLVLSVAGAVVWAIRAQTVAPGDVATTVVTVATVAAMVVTSSTLVADAVLTDGWTSTRENLQTLTGTESCGLGDELHLPMPGSVGPLQPATEPSSSADDAATAAGFEGGADFRSGAVSPSSLNAVLPFPGMKEAGSWVSVDGAASDAFTGSYLTGWYEVGERGHVAAMVMGSFDERSGNGAAVQWGSVASGVIESVAIEPIARSGYFTDWSYRQLSVPEGADRVRLLVRDSSVGSGDAWIATSAPLAVDVAPLADAVRGARIDVLVTPPLAFAFPCTRVPEFEAGAVATAPGIMIQMWESPWQVTFAAASLADRYFRVPVQLDPAVRDTRIGAHLGDARNFVFVSQEYLTGTVARANAIFGRGG